MDDLFEPAFVEYAMATNSIPYLPAREPLRNDHRERLRFSEKWFEWSGRANHQHLLGVSREINYLGQPSDVRGWTTADEGTNYSYIYTGTIEGRSRASSSLKLLGEVVAHELAHQWQVDPNPRREDAGHDTEKQWDRSNSVCQMARSVTCEDGSTCPEFYDDHVAFHYKKRSGKADSEYRWIRERCEPVPQSYPTVPVEWWLQGGQCR